MYKICRKLLMQDATFSELRSQARHFFDLVEAGEVVRVLRHGRPIAEIHPIASNPPSWKQRPARPLAIGGNEIGRLIVEERRG
jgi:antitoxin (DNA-binding transcriptional repressor) of toxin-antitoxin stability system